MSDKFHDKYRISSIRLQNWDYGKNAIYFVTINTHRQEHFFGEIKNGKMLLSNLGTIADLVWHEIKNHFDIVELDVFVVMPNHVHGILVINSPEDNSTDINCNITETRHALPIPSAQSVQINQKEANQFQKSNGQKRFQNQGKNTLSSIVGSYKSAVSKHAHRLGHRFDWQSGFYDRIVRDEKALQMVRKYIENNVSNWEEDPFRKGSEK